MSVQGGVCLSRGVCLSVQGDCLPKRVCIPACNGADTPSPLWTEFLTHACENITFPQLLLRTVKIYVPKFFIAKKDRFCSELNPHLPVLMVKGHNHTERQAERQAARFHWNALWRSKIGPRPIPKRHVDRHNGSIDLYYNFDAAARSVYSLSRKFTIFCLYRGDQTVLTGLYNGCPWEIYLEAYLNSQYNCLKNTTAQLHFILWISDLRLNFSLIWEALELFVRTSGSLRPFLVICLFIIRNLWTHFADLLLWFQCIEFNY